MGRWSDADDAKLAQLWCSGKLDPEKLDSKSIHKALLHFGGPDERSYDSFASLYKQKAGKWKVEKTLAGGRRGGKQGKLQLTVLLLLVYTALTEDSSRKLWPKERNQINNARGFIQRSQT